MRLACLAVALSLVGSSAMAGGSSTNFAEPRPDPATRTMNRYEAKLWVSRSLPDQPVAADEHDPRGGAHALQLLLRPDHRTA